MHAPDELSIFAIRLEAIGAPYMVTGATAAILYGQPRLTNDLDVVLSLDANSRTALLRAFSESEFYVPPESVILTEQARTQRGHFNLIHLESSSFYTSRVRLSCIVSGGTGMRVGWTHGCKQRPKELSWAIRVCGADSS